MAAYALWAQPCADRTTRAHGEDEHKFTETMKWGKYTLIAGRLHRLNREQEIREGKRRKCECGRYGNVEEVGEEQKKCIGPVHADDGMRPQMPCFPPPFHLFLNMHLQRLSRLQRPAAEQQQQLPALVDIVGKSKQGGA